MHSTCGVNCATDCRAYSVECEGCNELQGRVSWAEFYGRERCPIYDCAMEKGLCSCKDCGKQPCAIWNETRNPDMTDEEFAADVTSRLRNLAQSD